ncbi:RHS repeat-associated core domain-containing protein [Pseudomonas sp. NPDC089422]|uniref:RHS repeat-associated core domain-containing protein n=1 Tax=Pseudomonas sp. NPDC089422 TaxID=3364466 RepID=UPI0038093C21
MDRAEKTIQFYHSGRVATELSKSLTRSTFRHAGGLLAQSRSSAEASRSIMAVNNTNTVMTKLGNASKAQFAYTPYGRRQAQGESNNSLAFNGEQLDSVTGCYMLGHYRLFSPVLQRLCSPDNSSPFGVGGLNVYAYCGGDPVNRVDPTGHSFFEVVTPKNVANFTGTVVALGGVGLATAGHLTGDSTMTAAGYLTMVGPVAAKFGKRAITGLRNRLGILKAPRPGTPAAHDQGNIYVISNATQGEPISARTPAVLPGSSPTHDSSYVAPLSVSNENDFTILNVDNLRHSEMSSTTHSNLEMSRIRGDISN